MSEQPSPSTPHGDETSPDSATRDAAAPTRGKAWARLSLSAFRYVLLAAVIAFAIWYFARMWNSISVVIVQISTSALVLSFVALLVGLVLNALSWTTLLNGLGHRVPTLRAAQIMLVGQLGKYVPGSVWAYVLQMELGREHGIARARVLVASLYAAGIGVVSSLLLGAAALPQIAEGHPLLLWLFLLLPIGLVCLHPAVMTALANLALRAFRREPLHERVRSSTIGVAVGLSLASYLSYGVHLWLLTDGSVAPVNIVLMSAALGLGFTAGLFAFILPSGAGVREAVLIALLGLVLTSPEAAALALLSRGMFTAGDLLTAGGSAIAAAIDRRRLREAEAASAEYADVGAEEPSQRSEIS